jgi:DNA repair exonuclease SbcCD ATPase subunit
MDTEEYSMLGNGIMEEIRNLLSQGKSSSEVIALGYKPPTVYKVRRQLRKKHQDSREVSAPQNEPVPAATIRAEGEAKKAGPPSLQEWLKRHGWVDKRAESATAPQQSETADSQYQSELADDQPVQTNSLQREFDQARSQIEKLEAEARQVEALRNQVRSLQVEVQNWQRTANETQKALEDTEHYLSEARRVIGALMPLELWAGHLCCVCGEPTDGVVDQETAAKLLERTGHKECLIKAGLRRRRHSFDLIGGAKIRRATVIADMAKHPNGILIVP